MNINCIHSPLLTTLALAGLIAFVGPASLYSQSPEASLSPVPASSEIVAKMIARNQERVDTLRSFTSQRTYDLDYAGFPSHKHARMVVDARFNAPREKDLKIISEEGSGVLRKHVLHKLVESELEAGDRENRAATALTEANNQFSLVGREKMDGRDCYVLNVKPLTKSKFLYDGKIWVDVDDFAVVQIRAHPARNPSFWIKRVEIEHRYQKVGPFWLPARNVSTSSIRLGGRALLTINYGSYEVEPKNALAVTESSPQGATQ